MQLFQLKYSDEIDFTKWGRTLYWYMFLFLPLIVLAETLVFFCWLLSGSFPKGITESGYINHFIVQPTIINLFILSMVYFAQYFFTRKRWQAAQAYTIVLGALGICQNIVYTHAAVYTIYIVLGLPIIVSLLFIDLKPLLLAAISSLLSLLVFCFSIAPRLRGVRHLTLPEVIGIITILVVLFTLGLIILRSFDTLVLQIILKKRQADHDSLTKVLNRGSFQRHIAMYTHRYCDGQSPFTLVICDIDNFKQINDTYGHMTGDRVLLCFSDTLRTGLRETDRAFRYGGEEFTLLIDGGAELAEQLVKNINRTFSIRLQADKLVPITFCAGICEYNRDQFRSINDFFCAADQCLYEAKRHPGKNMFSTWRAASEFDYT